MTNETLLAQRADEWLATGLRCQPADRSGAEVGVQAAYRLAGLPAPETMIWFDSPAAAATAVAILRIGHPGSPTQQPIVDTLIAAGLTPGEVQLGASVRPRVRNRPWALARAAIAAELGALGYARHWMGTGRRGWTQLVDQIATPLRIRLDDEFAGFGGSFATAGHEALLDAILGQHDSAWLGAFAAGAHATELGGLAQVARSAGWWWAFDNVALLTERPTAVHRDNLGRLHHADGPALAYPDGYGLHAWRGMPVPPEVAAELPTLTVHRVRGERNAEVRRVMLEHFGFDRYLRESGARKINTDNVGTLWRADLPGDEPLFMVEVVNASPEPDGTFRTYFLRVPPTVRTARAGIAWTFDVSEEEYAPLRQT